MKKSIKSLFLIIAIFVLCFAVNLGAFAGNEANDGNIKIQVATDKGSYGATSVAEITATITNVSGEDINYVTAQAVFDDLAPAGKRKSETSKSVDVLKAGESFSFTYKATLNKDEHKLNFFQKIILWFVRFFNGGYTADNDSISVITECVTEIEFGKFTAENVVQVEYEESVIETWDYSVDDSHVVITDEDGNGYINNRIIIQFITDDKEKIKSIISRINGKIVGISPLGSTYQVEVPEMSLEALKELCKNVRKIDGVWNAMYDETFQAEIDENSQELDCLSSVPNDPWKDTFQGAMGVDWDENNPDGYNWWLETIEAPSAWDYNERFSNIKIGVVDNGFDTNHEDLKITVLNNDKNSIEDHGTHVAGIIGATANNNTGITGLVWNKELFGIDVFETKEQKKHNISVHSTYQGIELALKNKCKIVNMSIGKKKPLKNNFDIIYDEGWRAANYILFWKEELNGEDFIIVQAAGNKKINSIRNGFFCSITDEVLARFYDEFKEELDDYTIEQIYDVYDHFIVVGGVEKESSGYVLFSYGDVGSNYGEQISISAPGEDIFSTVASGGLNGSYGNLPGTSMAAPMVTGVASLVWSINPDFTAGEVKDIVCNYTNKTAKTNKYSVADTRTYPIVNAKLAVEEAIRRTDNPSGGDSGNTDTGSTTITGTVKDWTTGNAISGAVIDVSKQGDNFEKINQTVTTNEYGEFSVVLPLGEYQLYYSAIGYEKLGEFIDIDDISNNIDLGTIYLKADASSGDTEDERTVTDSGICGYNVTWTLYDDGELAVSGGGEMYDYYNSQYTPWNKYETSIKKIKIKSGVTRIGRASFWGFTNITEVTIANTVKSIGFCAFNGCINIKEIVIPYGVKTIDDSAFRGCSNLVSITLPDSITYIGEFVFHDTAFYGDSSNWKDNDLYINNHFIAATNVQNRFSYIIREGTKTIAGSAFNFENYSRAESIILPDSIVCIGSRAFSDCRYLSDLNIPKSVRIIGASAFNNCDSLTSLSIPDGVTIIEGTTFLNCDNLSNIDIPNSVTYIGDDAFHGCRSLTRIDIPDSVTYIGECAFASTGLTSVILPDNINQISYGAFCYCDNLSCITIPERITVINENAFYSCDNITDIYYTGTQTRWNNISVDTGNEYLTNAIIHYNS